MYFDSLIHLYCLYRFAFAVWYKPSSFFLGGDLVWEIQLDVLGMAARQAGLHRNVVWVLHILPLHDPPLRGCALADRKGNCTICVVIQ